MGAVSSLTSFATANVYIRRSTSCFRRSPHERVAKAVRLSLGGVDCPAGEKLAAVPTVAAARVGLGIVNKTTATSLCDALYTANYIPERLVPPPPPDSISSLLSTCLFTAQLTTVSCRSGVLLRKQSSKHASLRPGCRKRSRGTRSLLLRRELRRSARLAFAVSVCPSVICVTPLLARGNAQFDFGRASTTAEIYRATFALVKLCGASRALK